MKVPFEVLAIIVVAVIVLFYPKECGSYGREPLDRIYSDCSCAGLKIQDEGGYGLIHCMGIPLQKSCYVLAYNESNVTVPVPSGGLRDFMTAKREELKAHIVESVDNDTIRVVWGVYRKPAPCS